MTDRMISEDRIERALRVQADEALRPFDPTEVARLAAGTGSILSRRWDSLFGRQSRQVRWALIATALLLLAGIAAVVGASLLRGPIPLGSSPLFTTQWICEAGCEFPTGVRASTIDPRTGQPIASWDLSFNPESMAGPSVQPEWSPDRRHVLLYDWRNQLVAIVDVATGTLANVADDYSTGITGYTWGPGSDRIARVGGSDDADGVAIVDLDLHQLARFVLPHSAMIDSRPAWSPDGSTLVVVGCLPCDRSDKGSPPMPSQRQLFVMPVDGSPIRAIPITSASYVGGMPAWSPDSKTVALGSDAGIWTIGLADGQQRAVGSGPGYDPRWSPDGTRLAFGSAGNRPLEFASPATIGLAGIVVVDLQTGRSTTLTNSPDVRPRWSPEGTWIIFSRGDESDIRPGDVWIVPANGGEPRLVVTKGTVGW